MARKASSQKKANKRLKVKKVPLRDLPAGDKTPAVKGGRPRNAPPYVPVGPAY